VVDGGEAGAAIAELVELDRAILAYEGVPPEVARAIAGRAKLFATASVTVDRSAPPAVERRTLTLFIDRDGALRTDDGPTDLQALAPRLRALAAAHGQLVLAAPADLPPQRLVDLLTAVRAQGVDQVLFQVSRP
jgi:biopolymer transport protein ExbD